MTGSCVSSCCRSASMTAAHGALDAKMPSIHAPDTADAGIASRQISHHIPGAVGGIIVDEDNFPGDSGERGLQPPQQRGDVVAFVEGGDDDRKLRQTGGLRRIFGARSDGFIHAASLYPQPQGKPRRSSEPVGQDTDAGKRNGPKGPKMPTTTNRGRAYIRRSRAIQWSSQRRSYEATTSPLHAR